MELAAGGDFSYTFALQERWELAAGGDSRIRLYYRSDGPRELAVGGDFSYTFVLPERRSRGAGFGRRLLVEVCTTGATVLGRWLREATSRMHLYYGSNGP